MKYIYCSDIQWQIKYYINLSIDIANGVFTTNKLILLPYKEAPWWYFPDIGLFNLPEINKRLQFLSQIQLKSEDFFYAHNQEIFDFVESNFPPMLEISGSELKLEKLEFEKHIPNFENFIETIFGNKIRFSNVFIIPTKFGTSRTYATVKNGSEINLVCAYSLGNINSLIEGIFSGIINNITNLDTENFDELDHNQWKYRETLLSFFIKYTLLTDNSKSLPTSSEIFESRDILKITDSIKYYSKMNLDVKGKLTKRNAEIYYLDQNISNLTKLENQILSFLIENRLKTCDFDTLAKVIWKDEWRENFSIEAIARNISRIRSKLTQFDIPSNTILTIRGVGYMLFD